jgi:AraC-like DNA-binding protein
MDRLAAEVASTHIRPASFYYNLFGFIPSIKVAYMLAFEYPQSFSKLFKSKTNVTPIEYKNSFY